VAIAIIESKKGNAIIQSFSEGTINQESVCPAKRDCGGKEGLKKRNGVEGQGML
jgi:hypothetical protein